MTDEEKVLRAKFYLAPSSTTLEELRRMEKEYTSYPGLTLEQAKKMYDEIMIFKNSLDHDNVGVWIDGVKKVR